MAALALDGCVHLSGCLGKDQDGDEQGQWFNTTTPDEKLEKRLYRPSWKDPRDNRETFTWENRLDLNPLQSCWQSKDGLVPRFLLVDGRIPSNVCLALEGMLQKAQKKKRKARSATR